MNAIPEEQENNHPSLELLSPYENALRLANPGINPLQARTMVYWALSTYYDFDPKPILLILKSFGCGKTDLLNTLFQMAKDAKWINGERSAVIRDELHGCGIAFLDEKEDESLIPEGILTKRFKKANSSVSVNRAFRGAEFHRQSLNVHGWTALARRKRFSSVALMSRCLIIEPDFVQNPQARIINVGSLQGIFEQLGEVQQLPWEGRARQIWKPLAAIAERFSDTAWINHVRANIASDAAEQALGRQYEPDEAVIGALEICRSSPNYRLHEHWIKISDIKRTANTEYEMNLKPEQIAATLHRQGRRMGTIDGYPVVWVD